jgi:hypothetical protein
LCFSSSSSFSLHAAGISSRKQRGDISSVLRNNQASCGFGREELYSENAILKTPLTVADVRKKKPKNKWVESEEILRSVVGRRSRAEQSTAVRSKARQCAAGATMRSEGNFPTDSERYFVHI